MFGEKGEGKVDWSVFIILNPNLSVSVISDIWLGWTGNKSLSNRSSAGSESESKYIVGYGCVLYKRGMDDSRLYPKTNTESAEQDYCISSDLICGSTNHMDAWLES